MKAPLTAISLLLSLLLALPSMAKPRKPKPKEPEVHTTVISSVAPGSITILEDKMTKTFVITQFTEVTVNGQRARLTDLQPGMSVHVTLGADPTKLSRI